MIPLLHDLDGETVVVFGGGSVGARRARTFAAEADVVVISPTFVDEAGDAEPRGGDAEDAEDAFGGAQRLEAAPSPEEVPGWIDRFEPALVVAATDDETVNDAVEAVATERGVLLNRADRSGGRDPGHVAVPSIVRDGDVVVGISTGVPALTRELRRRIDVVIAGAGEMAALAGELRAELHEEYDAGARRAAVRAVVQSSSVWTALDTGRTKARQVADGVVRDVVEEHE